jgi:hypothetical protein
MLFEKKQCSICKNEIKKTKLFEYQTIEGNTISCCEKCSKYVKEKKKKLLT